VTYCLALRLDEGLVFMSDTRTNAGVDNVGTYRKLHVFRPAPDRLITLQSAGSLATTQEVLDLIARDLRGDTESLATVEHLFEAALYVGRLGRRVAQDHREALGSVGVDGTATFILGGQIGDAPPDVLLVYPEGNYIRASDDRPFLQIGESKYGKFILDFAIRESVDLETATKVGLGSMMSTARANLSVGPPYDGGVYRAGSHVLDEFRIEPDSESLRLVRELWERSMLEAVGQLPDVSIAELGER
jgi:putative proteasome-type protease